MDSNIKAINEKKIFRVIEALNKNNIDGYLVKNKEELIKKLKELIPEQSVVGCGGSMTLFDMGVRDFLKTGNYNFLDTYQSGLQRKDIEKIFKESLFSDVYLTSTNAITEKGELYNVDGMGNRVAAMTFGPEKVIVVVGVNKIVRDLKEAELRVMEKSAPANATRINKQTPCSVLGYCTDCSSSDRMCNFYTIIKRQREKGKMHVIFLNENLGY